MFLRFVIWVRRLLWPKGPRALKAMAAEADRELMAAAALPPEE